MIKKILLVFLLLLCSIKIFSYSSRKLPKATIPSWQQNGQLRTNVQTFNQILIATNVNPKDIIIVNKSTNGYLPGFYQRQGNNWALIQKLNFSTNTNTGASVSYTTITNISKKVSTNVVMSLSLTTSSATNISKYITTNQILIKDLTSKTTVSNITRYFITNGKLMLNITLIAHDSIRNPQMGDIICDGINDEVDFMSAVAIIRNSSVSGAKIDFSDGSFHWGSPGYGRWLDSKEYIISGVGTDATTIYADDGSNCDILVFTTTNGKNTFCSLQELTIFGNRANNPTGGRGIVNKLGKDFLIRKVLFYNMNGVAVDTTNCWNTKIQDSVCEDGNSHAFVFRNGQDGGVINCKILNMKSNSIYCGASFSDISGNYIWVYSPQNTAINMTANANYSTISRNRIVDLSTGSNSTAIQIASDRNTISENVVVGQGYMNVGYRILGGADANCGSGNVAYVIGGTNIINSGSSNRMQVNGNFIGNYNFNGSVNLGDGGSVNYVNIDADGDLTFTGTGDYLIGMNDYAFRYSGDEDAGMFFSTTDDGVLSYKDTGGIEIFKVGVVSGANSGNVSVRKLTTTSGHIGKIVIVTNYNYTISATNESYVFNRGTQSTNTLPPAVVGQIFYLKNVGAGNSIIRGTGSDTIDGSATATLSPLQGIRVQCPSVNVWVKW